MRYTFPFLLVAALTLAAPFATSQVLGSDTVRHALPSFIRTGTLPNGLCYYIARNTKPEKRVSVRLVVNAGSVLEDDDQRGLAHFTEHLLFNGTKRFPKQAIVKYLEQLGMSFGPHTNAETGFDATVYKLEFPTDSASYLHHAVDILVDWMSAVSFDSTAIDAERSIVGEEWRLRDLGASGRLSHLFFPRFFGNARYAERLPIGIKATLDTFKHDRLRQFYRDWYVPSRMAVVMVGDVDVEAMERLVREQMSGIPQSQQSQVPRPEPALRLTPTFAAADTAQVLVYADNEATSSFVETHWRHPAARSRTDAEYHRLVWRNMLFALINSRLSDIILSARKPPFRAASVAWSPSTRSLASAVLTVEPSDALITSHEAACMELQRIRQHGFLSAEVERVKNSFRKSVATTFNERATITSAARAEECTYHALTEDAVFTPEERYRLDTNAINAATPESIRLLACEFFPANDLHRLTIIGVLPQDSTGVSAERFWMAARRADAAQTESYKEVVVTKRLLTSIPAAGKIIRERRYPRIGAVEWLFANGARVILKPTDFKQDEVILRSFAEGGLSLASEQTYFAASMAAGLQDPFTSGIGAGAQAVTASELRKILNGKAATCAPYIEARYHGMNGSCSASDIETMLQLLYATHTAPRLDSTSVVLLREAQMQALANRRNDPQSALQDTIAAVLFDNHYTKRPPSRAMLDVWNHAKDGYPYFQARFRSVRGATFILAGAFTPERVKPLVARYIGGLPSRLLPEHAKNIHRYPNTGRFDITVRKGSDPQAMVSLQFAGALNSGGWTLERDVTATVLQVVLDTKLREALRNDAGGVYANRTDIELTATPEPRYQSVVQFPCAPERVDELTSKALAVIDSIRARFIGEAYLNDAKAQIRTARTASMRDNSTWTSRIASWLQQGESPERVMEVDAVLERVTVRDVQAIAEVCLERNAPRSSYARCVLKSDEAKPVSR
jgi:zinc protease